MTKLQQRVESLIYENAPDFEIARVVKSELGEYFSSLPSIFENSGGKDFLLRHTRRIDAVIQLIYSVATRGSFGNYLPLKNNIPITLVALGSYGREQLCVHSDIDIMFVYRELPGFCSKALIEKILYLLWDSGLKLGHRVHEVCELEDAAQSDITIKSAMLESRFIEGSRFLWTEIENSLSAIRKREREEFIRAKLEERRSMQESYPLTMEPNIKEGTGGFRDANTVFWIGKILYNAPRIKDIDSNVVNEKDYREFAMALEFLFRVRSALHIVEGKKSDRLRLELLPEVAKLLKYDSSPKAHMRFARKVIDQLKTINLYSRIWIEAMAGDIAKELYRDCFLPETEGRSFMELLDAMRRRAHSPFKAHPRLLHALIDAQKPERPDRDIYAMVAKIFEARYAHSVFESMAEARLLAYILPPMKKVVSLPQFDGYHRYSVDKHSLESLRMLENMEDEFLLDIYESLDERSVAMLKCALLLHDAGKGRKRDHRLVGASLFVIFARKIGMEEELVKMGETLILHHTLMSTTAQNEDIYSEKTILRFLSRFSNEKMLGLIYLLTYADMRGVGTDVYNDFSSKLLRTLYKNSLELMGQERLIDETAKRMKRIESLQRSPFFRELPQTLKKKILSIPSNAFFIRHSNKRIVAVCKAAHSTEDYSFILGNEKYLSIEIIRRHDFNLSYMLSKLSRMQVVAMGITKLFDNMKYFKIDFNERLDTDDIPLLERIIADSFGDRKSPPPKIPTIHPDEIEVDCEHSREYAMMKLRTADQSGLLAYLIRLFDDYGIDIASAKVHTIKGRVNDLFLIEKNGKFCHNIEKITKKLTECTCAE